MPSYYEQKATLQLVRMYGPACYNVCNQTRCTECVPLVFNLIARVTCCVKGREKEAMSSNRKEEQERARTVVGGTVLANSLKAKDREGL
jgi:hypothetical protein